LLFADVHDDSWASGSAFVIPPAHGSGPRKEAGFIRWILFATANNQCCDECTSDLQ
jgi:hypothetical protein